MSYCNYISENKTLYCSGGGVLSNQYNEEYKDATSIIIDDASTIAETAFARYSEVTYIDLGTKITSISDDPFPNAKITELYIPKSVTVISV